MIVSRNLGMHSKASVITIGMFDGVHEGHQKILRAVQADAQSMGAQSVVLTFQKHPQSVMGQRKHLGMITTNAQKLRLFEAMGISRTLLVPFNKSFSRITPVAFVKNMLLKRLGMKELCVGYDFAFGRDRKGNIGFLKEMSQRHKFRLRIFGPFRAQGIVVSSTSIRKFLERAKLGGARNLLGRFYSMEGVVERGLGLGRALGFPTANVRMANDVFLPNGVYAVLVRGKGFCRPGVLNVGYRPTLKNLGVKTGKTWELHVWNFRKYLYGKKLEIFFVQYLRPEKKFRSLTKLSAQIGQDVRKAKKILSKYKAL